MARNLNKTVTGDVSGDAPSSPITGLVGDRVSGFYGDKVKGRPGASSAVLLTVPRAALASGLSAIVPSFLNAKTGVAAALGQFATVTGGGQVFYDLPQERTTTWKPGVTYNGGIPARTTIFTTLSPLGGTTDDTAQISAAIASCPAGQTVKLNAGTFRINGATGIQGKSNVTLRGSGQGQTILARTTNGQAIEDTAVNGIDVINASGGGSITGYANIQGTANKGDTTIQVSGANAASLKSGFDGGTIKYVLVDMVTAATNVADPQNFAHGDGVFSNNNGNVWRSPDSEVFWPDRDSTGALPWYVGIWFRRNAATDGNDARPQGEIKQIASVSAPVSGVYTVTFTSPLHHWFNNTRLGQVAWWSTPFVEQFGIEELTVHGGGNGNVNLTQSARCWLKKVEARFYCNPNIAFNTSFQNEIRDCYIHDAANPYSGGGGYAIAIDYYGSELLIENCIIWNVEKAMVFRASGAGCVVAYNYVDAIFEGSIPTWQEVGINASHMISGYRTLFEGNWAQNFDSDKRWGPSNYMTVFRNLLRGHNEATYTWGGQTITENTTTGPARCAGSQAWGYWQSFVGNVLGKSGKHAGWLYETGVGIFDSGMWSLGWDDVSPYGNNANDAQVTNTALRDGNYDYLTNQVHWHGVGGSGSGNGLTPPAVTTFRDSLYLSSKPAFFGANQWPWIDAAGTTKSYTLPAKARFDAGTPYA